MIGHLLPYDLDFFKKNALSSIFLLLRKLKRNELTSSNLLASGILFLPLPLSLVILPRFSTTRMSDADYKPPGAGFTLASWLFYRTLHSLVTGLMFKQIMLASLVRPLHRKPRKFNHSEHAENKIRYCYNY